MASLITSLTIVFSTVYSGEDQTKHQSSASLAFVWGIHRWPVNSPHKWSVTRKMFPFDDVIMICPIIASSHNDYMKLTATSFILLSVRCNSRKFIIECFITHNRDFLWSRRCRRWRHRGLSELTACASAKGGRIGFVETRLSVYGHLFKCLIMF